MDTSREENQYLERLGRRIRSLREQKGWTLEEVEVHGWPAWRHLQRVEAGKNVTVITLRRVAKLYGITVSELLADI